MESQFSSQGNVKVNDNCIATHLFRIAQESLNNATKYSQSNFIGTTLMGYDEKISLVVKDKGSGFVEQNSNESSLVHRIMGYRANLIGEKISIDHGEDAGIQVSCILLRQSPDSDKGS